MGKKTFIKSALVGNDIFAGERISICLKDNTIPLKVEGKTILKGTCYVPKAIIEKEKFLGSVPGLNNIKDAITLPLINNSIFEAIIPYMDLISKTGDSIINYSKVKRLDKIVNSFTNAPIVIKSSEKIFLEEKL